MIYVICTFFIALILQCTTREFVFIAGYKMSHSAWRSIHWMSLSFTLSDSEGSIFLLIQDLPKLEQGEEFSRIMEGELDSTSKLEIYKTAIAFCTWPSKMFITVGWRCTLPVHILWSSLVVSNWGAHTGCLSGLPTHSSDPSSDQRLLMHPSEALCAGKPGCSPGNTSAPCCSHLLTEGPLPESGISLRKTAADSSWMAAETWNPAQIFICFTIIKRFNLRRAGRL